MVERLGRIALVACALALAWPVGAKQAERAAGGVVPGGRDMTVAAGARFGSVIGSAWEADDTPIPFARVRLRGTLTGQIAEHAVANESGQFSFRRVEPGSYLLELVSEYGKVLAVGHVFTIGPGETLATFVRLGTRVPWFTGFFSNAAAAVASSAAAAGVTAVAPDTMRAVSATQ